jgi:flagellar P-ring protein precursor FlgI
MRLFAVCVSLLVLAAAPVRAERLKDLADLTGARSNQLLGYGLVVGLPGTGDDIYSGIGAQSVATMLRQLGVNLDANNLRLRNVAAVMLTSEMPAFVAPGQRLDVTASSVGNARSLEGGTLVASPLKGVDLKVYAMAQGALSVGGYFAQGRTGSRLQKNITTVGRIPGGALVEREVPVEMPTEMLHVTLKSPDFTTAVRMAQAVDKELIAHVPPGTLSVADANARGPAANANTPQPAAAPAPTAAANPNAADPNAAASPVVAQPWAVARDSGTVEIRVPVTFAGQITGLMAMLEAVEVQPDWPTRVIINERTGTVVLGDQVRLAPVAIAHGGLTLEVREQPLVSQPGPFSSGTTQVVNSTQIAAEEGKASMTALSPGTSLGEVVKALNTLGVSPRDLLAILQALKSSGALRAELEIQ